MNNRDKYLRIYRECLEEEYYDNIIRKIKGIFEFPTNKGEVAPSKFCWDCGLIEGTNKFKIFYTFMFDTIKIPQKYILLNSIFEAIRKINSTDISRKKDV